MSQTGIATELIDYLHRDPRVEGSIGPDTELVESGRIDSLTILDLVVFVEERYGVALTAEDLTPLNLSTVTALSTLVASRV
ncbi:MAG TPA: acyl carrier protein [Gemmatimonadota bacterium]|nr:acyl carrier protein [Gemmatimonadota bacterium]